MNITYNIMLFIKDFTMFYRLDFGFLKINQDSKETASEMMDTEIQWEN